MFDQVGGGEDNEKGSMLLGCVLSWLCFPFSLIAVVLFGAGRTQRGGLLGGTLLVTLMIIASCANYFLQWFLASQ